MKSRAKKHRYLRLFLYSFLAIVVILLLIVAVAIIRYDLYRNSLHLSGSKATHLTISRENTLNQSGVSNFKIATINSSAVKILRDIDSLRPTPAGETISCPIEDEVEYSLKFTDPSLNGSASPTGCQMVEINNQSYISSNQFWNDISSATHQPIDPDTSL